LDVHVWSAHSDSWGLDIGRVDSNLLPGENVNIPGLHDVIEEIVSPVGLVGVVLKDVLLGESSL
jgi:hypothetical protein